MKFRRRFMPSARAMLRRAFGVRRRRWLGGAALLAAAFAGLLVFGALAGDDLTTSDLRESSTPARQPGLLPSDAERFTVGVVRLVVALRPTPTSTPAPTPTPAPAPVAPSFLAAPAACAASMDGFSLSLLNAMNAERTSAGLAPLAANPCVTYVAHARAATMAGNGSLAHSDSQGSSFSLLRSYGVAFGWAAENIGRNSYAGGEAVTVAMRAFMASGGHRDNVLGAQFTNAGVGAVVDASGVTYFVVVFIGA